MEQKRYNNLESFLNYMRGNIQILKTENGPEEPPLIDNLDKKATVEIPDSVEELEKKFEQSIEKLNLRLAS